MTSSKLGSTLLALGFSSWEGALVRGIAGESTTHAQAVRRSVDVVELLALVASGTVAAVVLDAQFPRLDATVVDRLAASGVVLVALSADVKAAQRLTGWGISGVIEVDPRHPEAAAALVTGELAGRCSAGTTAVRSVAASVLTSPVDAVDSLDRLGRAAGRGKGRLVAVWGPIGSPGRTTVALSLAEIAAKTGRRTLLVDCDLQAPGVTDALGMAPDASGLIAAARHAEQGSLDPANLARLARGLGDNLRVLTGIPAPHRRDEIRPAALRSVWSAAIALADLVIVDIGSHVDADAALDSDVLGGPGGANVATLEAADVLIVVTSCEPAAVARTLSSFAAVRSIAGEAELHVVINKVRSGVVSGSARRQLRDFMATSTGADQVWLVPDDRDACDAAAGKNRTLVEHDPHSPASAALADVAAAIATPARSAGSQRADSVA